MHIAWDDLQTVESLVRTGSIVRAAAELSLRHTSISRRIDALERALGKPLFLRGPRLVPTPLGRAVAERAAEMHAHAVDITALLDRQARIEEGRVTITTNDVLAPLLFRALARTKLGAKQVEVRVSDAEQSLAPGATDLALRPSHTPGSGLRGQRVGELRVSVFAAKRTSDDVWILPTAELRGRASMRWWGAIPKSAASHVTCDSLLSMRDACAAGLGKAVLPSFLGEGDTRLVELDAVDRTTPVWLLSPATRSADRTLRAMRTELTAALRASPKTFA